VVWCSRQQWQQQQQQQQQQHTPRRRVLLPLHLRQQKPVPSAGARGGLRNTQAQV
jgi:hypothetical protein